MWIIIEDGHGSNSQYFHNKFKKNVTIDYYETKSNVSHGRKLDPATTHCLKFIIQILQKYYKDSTSLSIISTNKR